MIPATNCGPLSEIMLSGSLCNFQILSLNNCVNPSALIFSVVGMKCAISQSICLAHFTSCNVFQDEVEPG